jgi:hypothetical protein
MAVIPSSITNIGNYVFLQCSSLVAITVEVLNPSYTSLNGVLFNKSQTTLVAYPPGNSESYAIPNTVTSIGNNAFLGCSLTNVTIPNSVTNIGSEAFAQTGLTSVTIPKKVTSIGEYAFDSCSALKSVFFEGNTPSIGGNNAFGYAFGGYASETIFHLPGTTGWGSTLEGLSNLLWLPEIQSVGGSFGVGTRGFGFNISWAASTTIIVETCTNLASPRWSPLATNVLTNGSFYFSEHLQTNIPECFYRVSSP